MEADNDRISAKSAQALWNLLAIPFATLQIWFWVDISQPDEESSLPFMANFNQDEVFILALPVTAIFLSVMMTIAIWHVVSQGFERTANKTAEFLPSIPKIDLRGKQGRLVRWIYFLGMTLGPLAMLIQCVVDFLRAKIVTKTDVVAANGWEALGMPLREIQKATGSDAAYRFVHSDGKEAFPPFQHWFYLVLVLIAVFMVLRFFAVLRLEKTAAKAVVDNPNVEPNLGDSSSELDDEIELKTTRKKATAMLIMGFSIALVTAGNASVDSPDLAISISKELARQSLQESLPDEVQIKEKHSLPDLGVWKEVELRAISASLDKDSLGLRFIGPDKVEVTMKGIIRSDVGYKYLHQKIEWKMKKIPFGKTKLPVYKDEWKERIGTASAPFDLKVTLKIAFENNQEGEIAVAAKAVSGGQSLKIGKITTTKINENLGKLMTLAGNMFGGKIAQKAFEESLEDIPSAAFGEYLPPFLAKKAGSLKLTITESHLQIIFP